MLIKHSRKINGRKAIYCGLQKDLRSRFKVHRETFELILGVISPFNTKALTNFQPDLIEVHRQLILTFYRLAHGCSVQVIADVFGISKALASEMFNFVACIMVVALYDRYVPLPETIEEWKKELKGFIESYTFPYIGAWDGCHVDVATRLKIIVLSSISIPLVTWV